VKAEPLEPAGVVWSARRAPTSQFSARSFSPGVVGMSVCGMKSLTLGGCGSRASLTPKEIVGWSTAEVVGTDSGTVHDRMSVGAVEALQMSRWRNRIRAWGSGEPATYHPGSWDVEQAARVLKGGLEFSAERSLESGRTRLRCCVAGCQ
jgi:hypothetical protein